MVERANSTSDPSATPFSWQGRRVFLTGHTGFKGGWLALFLTQLGATVRGYALDPSSEPNLLTVARVGSVIEDIRGDVRDAVALERAMQEFAPEVVFHLAAQPIVRLSYEDPIGTIETNVMGTARVLDSVRRTPSVAAVVCVTSDKCYENKEWIWPYRESDPLGGYDPYSASKACAEIVCATFRQSYFPIDTLGQSNSHGVAIATARAGNVIGGGDWSIDRLIPDLVRGFLSGQPVGIRRPMPFAPGSMCSSRCMATSASPKSSSLTTRASRPLTTSVPLSQTLAPFPGSPNRWPLSGATARPGSLTRLRSRTKPAT
jgi:CDP-glucose 4,6-dehydratase